MLFYTRSIPENEKQIIERLFYELQFDNSYYTTLQLTYNNNRHFTTVGADKNLCTYEILSDLGNIAQSEDETIFIEGTIHSNYHASGVLFERELYEQGIKRPLFVKDTYIRISLDNMNFMHLLITPPNIEENVDYIFYNDSFANGICNIPLIRLIHPTVSIDSNGGDNNKRSKHKRSNNNKRSKHNNNNNNKRSKHKRSNNNKRSNKNKRSNNNKRSKKHTKTIKHKK
jgi:hypothetical protein